MCGWLADWRKRESERGKQTWVEGGCGEKWSGISMEKFGVEFGMGKGKREKYDSSIHSPHAHVGS